MKAGWKLMKRAIFYMAALVVIFLFVGCNQQCNVGSTEGVQASLGTYNYGGSKPGIAFLIVGNMPMTGPEGVEVTVTGPSGWNGGNPLKTRLSRSVSGPGWWKRAYPIELVDGSYTLETQLPGGIHLKKTATLKASEVLARPAPRLTASATQATISWKAVPGAKAYSVNLWRKTSSESEFVVWWRTTGTSITFSGLELTSGETYYANVWAYNAELTKRIFPPPEIFKVSWARTDDFTVTSAGVLKILPNSGDTAPEGEFFRESGE